MLSCPSCKTPMEESKTRGVTIDSCATCGGAWFDEGELARVFTGQDVVAALLVFEVKGPVELGCPRCQKPMQQIRYPSTDVVMEQCPACRGLWVTPDDIPGIQALIARSPRAAARRPPATPVDARLEVSGGTAVADDADDPEAIVLDVLELMVENVSASEPARRA